MESLEGYSYYDTPLGPQYVRNDSANGDYIPGANPESRHPSPVTGTNGIVKFHPYAQAKRIDRGAQSASNPERRGSSHSLMARDSYHHITIDPTMLCGTSEAAMLCTPNESPNMHHTSRPGAFIHTLRHTLEGTETLVAASTKSWDKSLPEGVRAAAAILDNHDMQYPRMSPQITDGSALSMLQQGEHQEVWTPHSPWHDAASVGYSIEPQHNTMVHDTARQLAQESMHEWPASSSSAFPSNPTPLHLYPFDTALFEYGPFHDLQSSTGSLSSVWPTSLEVAASQPQPRSISDDEQERPLPQVALVGGYFAPDDDAAAAAAAITITAAPVTAPEINSKGNIRITRLPPKKSAVAYEIPAVPDMTVTQLKSELKKHGLSAVGKKQHLQARLAAHLGHMAS